MASTDQELPDLTDKQRAAITKFFHDHPDGGYKSACKAAGILRLSKDQARQLIEQDDELSEEHEQQLGVRLESALRRIAKIAEDLDHKDSYRANTFIAGALHGVSESSRVELTGAKGGPVSFEDRSASLKDVAAMLRQVGALDTADADGS